MGHPTAIAINNADIISAITAVDGIARVGVDGIVTGSFLSYAVAAVISVVWLARDFAVGRCVDRLGFFYRLL